MKLPLPVRSALLAINTAASQRIRFSKTFTRAIFGLEVSPNDRPLYWDYSTLLVHQEMHRWVRDGMRVLEIGTGEHALIGLSARARYDIDLTCTDLIPEAIDHAKRTAERNRLEVDFRAGDLFEPVADEKPYDLIFNNPPYLTPDIPDSVVVGTQDAPYADGGEDGMHVIRRVLHEAPPFLAPGGKVLMATNRFYVAAREIDTVIASSPMRLVERIRRFPNPTEIAVYEVR